MSTHASQAGSAAAMADDTIRESYERVPYLSGAHAQSHPERLATLATLFGATPPPLSRCRVLELGCGSGGNLLPVAQALPGATLLGIDLSDGHVRKGQGLIEQLGLTNISLRQQDLMDFREPGPFDYIIAHGVFSWVPAAVQERILEICAGCLAPGGVAYVSYNTYPGWHTNIMLREMMCFHVRGIDEPRRRVAQGRALSRFLAEAVPEDDRLYASIVKEQHARLGTLDDEYLYHDDLGEVNEPLYFHQFMERAGRHRLKYLGEAVFADMQDGAFSPAARAFLQRAGDLLVREQYMDFLRGRSFRQTLLCHQDVALDRRLTPGHARRFFATSLVAPASPEPDLRSAAVEEFRAADGGSIGIGSPLSKAALLHLHEAAPGALSFDEILGGARARLGRGPGDADAGADAEDETELGELLLAAYGADMVSFHTLRPALVTTVSERPVASPLARLQAREGPVVASLCHHSVAMNNPYARHLLAYLDGQHDRPALIEAMTRLALDGRLVLRQGGEALGDPDALRALVAERLEPTLRKLARGGLLCG